MCRETRLRNSTTQSFRPARSCGFARRSISVSTAPGLRQITLIPLATTFQVAGRREASCHSFTPQGAASPYRKLPVSRNGQGQQPQVDLVVREGFLRYRHLRPNQPLTSPQLAVGIELWIPASI